jgi:hypothetical protein
MIKDQIILKWGTLKGYCLENSPEALETIKKYYSKGFSLSAAMQEDTKEQKELLCKAIDEVKGVIINDWTGNKFKSKKAAKKYIMEYGA